MSGRGNKSVEVDQVRQRFEAVITELERHGLWDTPRPSEDKFENMGAFGINTMPFTDWLRWVFVPRVEALIESNGPWPEGSSVAQQAAREGDTDHVVQALVPALAEFDSSFVGR